MNERVKALDSIAATINPAELSADAAALDASRTLTALLEARQQCGLPLPTGLLAIGKVAQATIMAVQAREELIRAHGLLNRIGTDLGMDVAAFGKDVPPAAYLDEVAAEGVMA